MGGYTNVAKFCEQTGHDPDHMRAFAKRKEDPLPLRYMPGQRRNGFFIVDELDEWLKRNTCFMNERG